MLCPVCKTMAGIVEVTETEMVYNCRNPKCPMYGKEVARQREDYKEGRPKREIPDDFEKYCEMQSTGEISVRAACKEMGISTSQWYKWVKEVAA